MRSRSSARPCLSNDLYRDQGEAVSLQAVRWSLRKDQSALQSPFASDAAEARVRAPEGVFLFFCRLTENIMEGLRIAEHADKRAEKCSGGTKRKLSYGMAMLGDPKIVLMDEPSTGMDPQSKRFVWDTILASFKV